MSNNFFNVQVESSYGYRLNTITGNLTSNVLNMQTFFQNGLSDGSILSEDLDLIAVEMENTAKRFALEQGLGPSGGTSLLHYGKDGSVSSVPSKGNTGNLYTHIKAVRDKEKVTLSNDAQNSRGQYYAGHIEFGFRNRGGGMVPARPFLRPALYAVADASRGRILGTLKRYLEEMWTLEELNFGSLNVSRGRAREFYKLANNPMAKNYGKYTVNRLPKGRLSKMNSLKNREKQTVHRDMSNDYSKKVGQRMGHSVGQKDARGVEHISNTQWHKTGLTSLNEPKTSKQKEEINYDKNSEKPYKNYLPERKTYYDFLGTTGKK